MFFVERFHRFGWRIEGTGHPNRSEALQSIENLRARYGRQTQFRIVVR